MHLIFDISMIVTKPWEDQPRGIDRVVFAHTRHWRSLPKADVTFVIRNARGQLAALPDDFARRLLDDADNLIARGISEDRTQLRARFTVVRYMQLFGLGRRRLLQRLRSRPDSVLLSVEHLTLDFHDELAYLRQCGCRVASMIHDVIPIRFPQYCPKDEEAIHKKRISALARLCDVGFSVSHDALADIEAYASHAGLSLPPMKVVYSGLDLPSHHETLPATEARPYFLMLGTLDPRKNHLMMLQLWQQMENRQDTPRLLIVGHKSNDPFLANLTLERVDFQGCVEYLGRLNDDDTAALLKGARALLFPSLAEGFGLPLAEALAAGVPAIVSDIAAFRECGGDVPEYIDPLDGPGWKAAILQYAKADSPQRAAQLERMKDWRPHSWQTHFATVQSVLEKVAHAPQRTWAA